MSPRVVTLTLPALPALILSSNERLYWRAMHEAKATQVAEWSAYLHNAGVRDLEPFCGPVSVRITVRGTGRKTDPQNWTTNLGLKVLLDCLTPPKANKIYGLGLIPGDGCRDMVAYEVAWGGADGPPETIVEIREG